jgi:phage terminase large subunit
LSAQRIRAEFPDKLKCLFEPARYKVLYGGRGGAKSWGVARSLLIQAAQNPLRVLCAREFQNSIRDSVHKLLSDQVEALGLSYFYDCQNTVIRGLNGTEFTFEGLHHNVTKIKSYEGADRVWVEEAQAVSKKSWDILIPTIRKDGSEIWMTFNPEFEDDETYQRFVLDPPKSAKVVFINYQDNPFFPAVLEEERLELKRKDPDAYDHVWDGKCKNWVEGAIYANELRAAYDENRVREVPFDPAADVYTAWDIGHTDDTAIWWYQVIAGEIHIIESYALSGGSPSHFVTQVLGVKTTIDIVDGEPVVKKGDPIPGLEHRTKYKYAGHWLPHDARAKTFAASGKSVQQQLLAALGWGKVRIAQNLSIEDGIQAARTSFPRCYFDKDGCSDGLRALRKYQRKLQADEVSLKRSPEHDWSSHYADAFRYLAIAWREKIVSTKDKRIKSDGYGLDDDNEQEWKTA